jgi:uncharacterized delta-60 repeat protein
MSIVVLTALAGPANAAAGGLDPGFGAGGKLTTDLGGPNEADAVIVQPDGKIVVAGGSFSLAAPAFELVRYDRRGRLDPSFGIGGTVVTSSQGLVGAQGAVLQEDGKIVTAGVAFNGTAADFALARYNPDGSLDPTFDADGIAITQLSPGTDAATGVALQDDGTIVAVGFAFNGSDFDFALARYQVDGSIDPTFEGDGIVVTPIGLSSDTAQDVAIQPDGRIVAAGQTCLSADAICDFALARYRPDGSLDPTPDHDGIVVTAVSHDDDAIGAVAIQPSGRIVAGGSAVVGASYDFALSRYEKDGSLDVSFGDDGVTTTDFFGLDDSAPGLAVLPGGKVIVGGSAVSPVTRSDFALARYSKDGSLDPTFDGNGTTATDFFGLNDFCFGLAVQPDGRTVAVGRAFVVDRDIAAARYLAR